MSDFFSKHFANNDLNLSNERTILERINSCSIIKSKKQITYLFQDKSAERICKTFCSFAYGIVACKQSTCKQETFPSSARRQTHSGAASRTAVLRPQLCMCALLKRKLSPRADPKNAERFVPNRPSLLWRVCKSVTRRNICYTLTRYLLNQIKQTNLIRFGKKTSFFFAESTLLAVLNLSSSKLKFKWVEVLLRLKYLLFSRSMLFLLMAFIHNRLDD